MQVMSSLEESLKIPTDVRLAVWERDGGCCRLCGQTVNLICHHVMFGGDAVGMGGRRFHSVDNIVLLGGIYGHRCHDRVHEVKHHWQPLLQAAILLPGTTALQINRWLRSGQTAASLGLPAALTAALERPVEPSPTSGPPGRC